MTNCPECDAEIEPDALDEFDADIGDRLVCTVCAVALKVVKVSPVEVAVESDEAADDLDDDRPAGASAETWEGEDLGDPGDEDEWDA